MQLDEAQLNALKPADRNRYRALEQLFAQPGWKIVITLAKEHAANAVQRAAFAASWADNRIAIGNGAAWDAIAKLEEQTEAHYAQMLAEIEKATQLVALADESSFE